MELVQPRPDLFRVRVRPGASQAQQVTQLLFDDPCTEQGDTVLTTSDQIRDTATRMGDIGADEVMFYCWASDVSQVDRFAGALSGA
ncbi:hypothetical protein [Streptosporangium lutulentum]|uniref:Uncharacterized protein n=1 Tax=Streptosporangium lutulentum TaxID=1461250 RepID=A0ABT9Q2Y5_9ACTN|nr:hypothetical protein [Streptosporangium lutulentum]MDP9841096.1 hypothetical protein [Streptosporangium lutulentum]